MPMYNLIEYSDNYSDSSGSLYQFKRDKSPMSNDGNPLNVALNNSSSFKYKASPLGKATDPDGNNRSLTNTKIVAPLKYLPNFFFYKMPLIKSKIHLELNWNDNCAMYGTEANADGNDRETTFKITSTKLYIPIVTLSTKDNVNFTKQLNEKFESSVHWNEYKSKKESKEADKKNLKRFPLDASFQGTNRLFVLAFNNTTEKVPASNTANRVQIDSHRKYFLPRVDITNYNVLIDGRNFYDQPINDQFKNYDQIRKIAT